MLLNTTSYINDHTQFVTSHRLCNNVNTILCEIQTKPLLGAFTFLQRVPIIFDMFVHPSAHISLAPTGQFFFFNGNMCWSIMQMEYTVAFP
jgi:hypothetical protein